MRTWIMAGHNRLVRKLPWMLKDMLKRNEISNEIKPNK